MYTATDQPLLLYLLYYVHYLVENLKHKYTEDCVLHIEVNSTPGGPASSEHYFPVACRLYNILSVGSGSTHADCGTYGQFSTLASCRTNHVTVWA